MFPIVLDIDNPKFRRGLERLREINDRAAQIGDDTSLKSKLARVRLGLSAAKTFASLYLLPVKGNEVPDTSRLEPVW